jgi:hypothetical protein
MRREVRRLKQKAIESLVLSIELFNRPSSGGRTEAVLMHADLAVEMLLKAVIAHRGGPIRRSGAAYTIGFKDCVSRCLTDADVKCITPEQAITLQALNGWRDAAQHYLLDLSEQQLYLAAQASVTLFDDLLAAVFGNHLRDHVPERVLPVSTMPPRDLDLLLDDEFLAIAELIRPGSRKLSDARSRLRPVAILDAATNGQSVQPSEDNLAKNIDDLRAGRTWRDLFPGVAGLQFSTDGSGLTYSLRISKKEGVAVRLVREGDSAAAIVAVKRVNELDYYSLGFVDLAEKLAGTISRNRLTAVIRHLDIHGDPKYYKLVVIGKSLFGRYSEPALAFLREALQTLDVNAVWAAELVARNARRSNKAN